MRAVPRVPAPDPAGSPLDLSGASALCLSPPAGKMAGIFGEGACPLALQALAPLLLAGETVVAVDGGNRFDPYAISRAAHALGGDARAALSRIRLSRAFTCHQLERLLSERLAPELSRRRARLALVLGLHESFRDADVPYREACALFRRSVSALRKLSASGIRVVLAGHPATGDRGGFFMHLARQTRPMLLVRVSRHPPAAAADPGMPTAFHSVGHPRRSATTPPVPSGRAPCIHARLRHLATEYDEKSGLVRREGETWEGTLWLDGHSAPIPLRTGG